MGLFKKSYTFFLSEGLNKEKIEDIFGEWKKGNFEGEFVLIKKRSEENIVFRYLVGKGGIIYVEFIKEAENLHVKITEGAIGFLMPTLIFILGLFLTVNNSIKLGLLSICFGIFLLIYTLFVFQVSINKIQKEVLSKLERT